MRLVALALALSFATPGWHTFAADGIRVRYPAGWHATSRALTPVTYPPQVLAIASYPLPRGAGGADGCEPKAAVDRLPPGGAFVFGIEYDASSVMFAPRPQRFLLRHSVPDDCTGGPSYRLRFRERGRDFQVNVLLGPRASAATRVDVLRLLDSFAVTRR